MAHDAEHDAPDETHVSPDGLLTLIVFLRGEASWIGFEGHRWHAHGDLLGDDPPAVVERIAKRILADKIVLELRWRGGALQNAEALIDGAGEPLADLEDHRARAEKYKLPDERLELRTWSGAKV